MPRKSKGIPETKLCARCQVVKPNTEFKRRFHRVKRTGAQTLGLMPYCIPCQRAASVEYKLNDKRKRLRDPAYLDAIRQCPCLLCANPAEAAHVRFLDSPGMGQTVGDDYVVPLCSRCHTGASYAQHRSGEEGWWKEQGIDPGVYTRELRKAYPDIGKMRLICFMGARE